jgi:pimeloyl-ACP methyl ester carboxylesterase
VNTIVEIEHVGRFDLYSWSQGEGPPVLYLHGFERHPGDAPFLRRLAESHAVLAPEQPGFGTSTGFEHIRDVVDLVLVYRTVVQNWAVGPVDVIGHSLGAMFAAELAALCPDLVRRLVLVDPFGVWLDDAPALDPFGPADRVAAALWYGKVPEDPPSNFVADPDDPHAALLFGARNLAVATKFLWPLPDRGLRRRLPYVAAETLVINGANDGLVPVAYAAEIARLVPNAELVTIDEAGHYPMIEQPDAFHRAVETFLADPTSTGGSPA